MPINKRIQWKRITLLLLLLLIGYLIYFLWGAFPVISGYSAKMTCSCVFAAGRDLNSVKAEELGRFPLNLARISVNKEDSSVDASVLGFAIQKAAYRQGLGCTLITGISEKEWRSKIFHLTPSPTTNKDSIPWPLGDLLPDSFPRGIDTANLRNAIRFAFEENDAGKPIRTRAVVVLYDGQLVGEQYAPGFDQNSLLYSWSMAKSIWGALTGIMVRDGRIDISMPAAVPEWRSASDGREKITVENLLTHTTGLNVEEDYTKASTATNMLYREPDMGEYAATQPLKYPPGSVFYYCSANSNILSRLIRQNLGDNVYHAFPATKLFHKVGMFSAILEPDASGTYVASSYMLATARDYARFGLLYLNNGKWNGEQLLPENWIKKSLTPTPVAELGEYGYHMRLNAGNPNDTSKRMFPFLPRNMFYAYGYEGEYIIGIPSKKLVIVRLGQTAGYNFDLQKFVRGVMASIHN